VKNKYPVLINLISFSLISLLKIIFIVKKSSLSAFVWLILLDSIILAFGYLYFFYLKANFSFKNFSFKLKIGKYLLKNSWPLIISGMLVGFYMKIDQIMIKNMLSESDLGQYAAALKISEIWYFIPVTISASLFPSIISAKKIDEKLYESRMSLLYSFLFWLAIIIGFTIILTSDLIIKILFGQQFLNASQILKIHIWTGIFVFIGVASSKWLIVENLQKITMYNTAIGAIFNVILNFILIKSSGINGAAWASFFSYLISGYLSLLFWKKTRQNFFLITRSFFSIENFNLKKITRL
jgi:O-antigen/teichoic acid export membrane protein